MKTLRITWLLLFLFALSASAAALPAPKPRATPTHQPPAPSGQLAQLLLLRYRYLQRVELPQLLAWLRDWGPFTQPPPGLLPSSAAPETLASQ